jgi:hypothetical protein
MEIALAIFAFLPFRKLSQIPSSTPTVERLLDLDFRIFVDAKQQQLNYATK